MRTIVLPKKYRLGVLCVTAMFLLQLSGLTLALGRESTVRVSGSIATLDYGSPVRISDATVLFQKSKDGVAIIAKTNKAGEYEISLDKQQEYTLTVTSKGFCPVHRPSFRLDSTVKFDFLITTLCPRDRLVAGSSSVPDDIADVYFTSQRPLYFEEKISMGGRGVQGLIIGFGRRQREGDVLKYSLLPIENHPGVHMPVTISFGQYTIRAKQATLNQKLGFLKAEGNVFVENGDESQPRSDSCVTIQLKASGQMIGSCQ